MTKSPSFSTKFSITLLLKFIGRFSRDRTIFFVCLTVLLASKNYIHQEFQVPLVDRNVHAQERNLMTLVDKSGGAVMQKFESIPQFGGFRNNTLEQLQGDNGLLLVYCQLKEDILQSFALHTSERNTF